MTTGPPPEPARNAESLGSLLGGRRAALDAMLPTLAFVLGWLASGHSIGWGVGVAVAVGAMVALLRLRRGDRTTSVLLGMLGVSVAGLVALRTGRAADFFLVQIVTNLASVLVWTISIAVRWPLLGVIVGGVLGQKASWRRDPALLRAYSLGSWVWVGQYLVRVVVFLPLWASGQVVTLGVTRALLSWPLVAACLASSWWVIRRALPDGHAGLRHPRLAPR